MDLQKAIGWENKQIVNTAVRRDILQKFAIQII